MSEEGKKEEDKKERRFSQEQREGSEKLEGRSGKVEKKNKADRKFSEEQYQMLKRCSEKKDMTEWNEWRKENPHEDILLEGAYLYKCYLKGVFLNKAVVVDRRGRVYEFDQEIPQKDAALYSEKYKNSGEVHLENANLRRAHLRDALLYEARLEGADLSDTCLKNVEFWRADIKNATFHTSVVDGSTLFWRCTVSRNTNFRGVGLDGTCIDAGTKQLLKYNIRRMNWEDWYKEHWFWRWPVQAFWAMSDYGMSTLRVVAVFFILALLFAAVYMNWAYWAPPGIIDKLIVQPEIGETELHYVGRALIRPVYFSVVTMTTLGFGDMYANKGSIAGHVLLILQVILGYVLLGALVTRFAVLFTAGGPAGEFTKEK